MSVFWRIAIVIVKLLVVETAFWFK